MGCAGAPGDSVLGVGDSNKEGKMHASVCPCTAAANQSIFTRKMIFARMWLRRGVYFRLACRQCRKPDASANSNASKAVFFTLPAFALSEKYKPED